MSSVTRHLNSRKKRASARVSGVRVRSPQTRGCPPGPGEEGGLERRSGARRPGRLLATALTLVAVSCVAAFVGEVLARVLVLSTPHHLEPRRETAP